MDFPTNLSSPARAPAFEARPNLQGGQDLSLERLLDEADGNSNTQHAAGGMCSSPFAFTYSPSVPSTSLDQLRALLITYLSTDVNAGRGFGLPNTGSPFNTSSQTSELSSSSSSCDSGFPSPSPRLIASLSPPPSSITSPSDDLLLSFTSPGLSFHGLSIDDQDPAVPLQAGQYPLDLSFSPNGESYSTPPEQPLFQPVALPEEPFISDVPIMDQCVGIDDIGAFPGSNSFLTAPSFSVTTALGLYYPSTPQNFHIPPLSIQVDSSILSTLPTPAPPAETRKVRAVVPPAKIPRVRSGKMRKPSYVVAAASISGTDEDGVLKCPVSPFEDTPGRKTDPIRLLRVPADHPVAASLSPGHSIRRYKGREFLGGCGKSYSRMDALQRHLGKSGCAGGSAKDHQTWRQLYF
ncbi:hypothetical protein EDB92DRAFT_1823564 [Lactarius akahatsu]|uniref:Uncharacterized protein n=1 Tax=Lactarius akahatsu TaxID=416441 RepID=A0AAD4Q4H2_9AGAM|nr:hypothetical protein EDB92DRAFT_1823564 [Lactarius akahatsu]